MKINELTKEAEQWRVANLVLAGFALGQYFANDVTMLDANWARKALGLDFDEDDLEDGTDVDDGSVLIEIDSGSEIRDKMHCYLASIVRSEFTPIESGDVLADRWHTAQNEFVEAAKLLLWAMNHERPDRAV